MAVHLVQPRQLLFHKNLPRRCITMKWDPRKNLSSPAADVPPFEALVVPDGPAQQDAYCKCWRWAWGRSLLHVHHRWWVAQFGIFEFGLADSDVGHDVSMDGTLLQQLIFPYADHAPPLSAEDVFGFSGNANWNSSSQEGRAFASWARWGSEFKVCLLAMWSFGLTKRWMERDAVSEEPAMWQESMLGCLLSARLFSAQPQEMWPIDRCQRCLCSGNRSILRKGSSAAPLTSATSFSLSPNATHSICGVSSAQ